jgi:putative ABC transport system permease protein
MKDAERPGGNGLENRPLSGRFKRVFRLERGSDVDARHAVDEELRHHVELATEELTDAGWDPAEARQEALRSFGDMDETRAYCVEMHARRGRDERRREMMSLDEIRQDVRYALRSIRKSPGYAGLVVLTLAFGIAANTTIFSVMNPYLFRPLPFGGADQLVQVNQVNPTTGWDMDRFSYPQYADWKERSRAFQDLAAYTYGSANVTDAEGPEQIQYSRLTSNMFDVLDAQAALGRTFRLDEGGPGGERVVVMAYGLWERRYASDPAIVGRAITLDGVQHTVVGVMPPDFNFPFGGVKLWLTAQDDRSADRGSRPYQLIGRLNDGWTADRTRSELEAIQAELATQYPDEDGRMSGVSVKPVREALNFAWEVMNGLFYVLLGAVAFVLLIACANVASLTLARGSTRLREVSVRAAMGARRGRLVRQLLTESLVLATAGGLVGVAMAYWITGLLNPVIPEDLFKIGAITIDRTVLAFSLVVTLATPVAFGLAPALSASRVDLSLGLKEGSKSSGGLATSGGRKVLVVSQVALAVVLISGAGLMLRSFASVQRLDLGFEPDRIVTTEVILGADAYPTPGERRAFLEEAVAAVSGVPGVASASAVRWLPLNHETISGQVAPSALAGAPAEEWPLATANYVYPGYFGTMGIEVVAGRDFAITDGTDSQPVVVVNRPLADRLWPGASAVGQTLVMGVDNRLEGQVIGVVEEVHHSDLDPANVGPQYYLPSLQSASRRFFVLGRTASDPADMVSGVRSALAAVAPDLPLTIRPYDDVVAENQMQWSIGSVFLGIFGGGALLLAALGIYGLISFSVAQRDRELGVRIALGATRGEIRRSVVGGGLRLTGVGLGIGLLAAFGLGRAASAALFGVSATDPVALGGTLVLFLGVSALASFVPAARASATDPITVLRSE